MSGAQSGLLDAILAVQAEATTLPKDKTAKVRMKAGGEYTYRYTDLATVVEQVGPKLVSHGLTWVTCPTYGPDGNPALNYRLSHAETKEGVEGTMPLMLPGVADSQALGSALTYARRYALCAVLNLVADDDDDGGHQASQRRPAGASSDLTTGKRNTGEPSPAQKGKLAQVMRPHKPVPPHVLAACLLKVGVKDVPAGALESGTWIEEVNAGQMSALIDLFQDGALPTGESDIPSDLEPVPEPVAGGEVPFE